MNTLIDSMLVLSDEEIELLEANADMLDDDELDLVTGGQGCNAATTGCTTCTHHCGGIY